MLKKDLEERVLQLEKLLKDEKEKNNQLEQTNEKIRNISNQRINDAPYIHWRQQNEKFLNRFLKEQLHEMIQNEIIKFDFKTKYYGYVTMNVIVNNAIANSITFQVNTNENPLDY